MKIGIYSQPSGGSLGGTEQCVAVLAESLQNAHEVEIVHHHPSLTVQQLADYCGVDLSKTRVRYQKPEPVPARSLNIVRHFHLLKQWHQTLSAPYDIFVNFTHDVPPFCHAPKGALAVLFPHYNQAAGVQQKGGLLGKIERVYSQYTWRARFATYQKQTAISEYTRLWTQRYWEIECAVLPPPVDTNFLVQEKKKHIVSVGRFATSGHSKKQLEMVGAFADIKPEMESSGWQYYCLGGLGERQEDQRYFTEVCDASAESNVHVCANLTRDQIKSHYETASIFWHAAGLNEDADLHPDQAEHFGITTVEAMAAGCVPVVINKGGQPELVQHGVSGFVWDTLEELKRYTLLLVVDAELRMQMSSAARQRAQHFSRQQYAARFASVLFDL